MREPPDDGSSIETVQAVHRNEPGGAAPSGQLLPPAGGEAGSVVRSRPGARLLRGEGPPLHRSGGLIQAPPDRLFRWHHFGAAPDGDGPTEPGPSVVPGVRPGRAAARPQQPIQNPQPLWPGGLPPPPPTG